MYRTVIHIMPNQVAPSDHVICSALRDSNNGGIWVALKDHRRNVRNASTLLFLAENSRRGCPTIGWAGSKSPGWAESYASVNVVVHKFADLLEEDLNARVN